MSKTRWTEARKKGVIEMAMESDFISISGALLNAYEMLGDVR